MKHELLMVALCLALPPASFGQRHSDYQHGTLLRMDAVTCGMQEKGSKTMAGELLGTDAQNRKTQDLLCQEYILQSDRVTYRIRPKDEKHPALLPIGETAQFRIHKDKLVLRVPEGDNKEHEYTVVSMVPREDAPKVAAGKN